MATIYVRKTGSDSNDGLSEGTAKLTVSGVAGALTVESNGDTINIGPGTYDEQVKAGSGITAYPLHFVGSTGDPTDVIFTHGNGSSGHAGFSATAGCTISHITIESTSTILGATGAALSIGSSATTGLTVTNCILLAKTIGFWAYKSATLDRCKIISQTKNNTDASIGIEGTYGSSLIMTVLSCFIQDFNAYGIKTEGRGNVINTTIQTDYRQSSGWRGMHCANSYNNIVHNNSGLTINTGIYATTIKNCISYGLDGDTDFNGTQTDVYDYAAVIADGNPIFLNESGDDFRIDAAGLAYQNGTYEWQTANSVPITDILNAAYDTSTPAIGCYEYVFSGYSQETLGVPAESISEIVGVETANIDAVLGVAT